MGRRHGVGGVIAERTEAFETPVEAERPLLPEVFEGEPAAERKGGRPPGAVNRKTADMIAWLERTHKPPLQVLAERWSKTEDELADELGCDRIEAAKLRDSAASAALRFWHQALSPDVLVNAPGFTTLNFITGPHLGVTEGGSEDLSAALAAGLESVQHQPLNEDDDDAV